MSMKDTEIDPYVDNCDYCKPGDLTKAATNATPKSYGQLPNRVWGEVKAIP